MHSNSNRLQARTYRMILITGGVRSGKSQYAVRLARQHNIAGPKYFLATAEPFDLEMQSRIANHQKERARDFLTIEEPIRLAQAMSKIPKECSLILIDCLTLWVSNLFFRFTHTPSQIKNEIESLIQVIELKKTDLIFVTNEVSLGLIPENPLGRQYIDSLGSLNQRIAHMSNEVIFMVAGIPTRVKGEVDARVDH